ncbi:acyclic sesquiterpene synthase-like isoform X2 [Panicum miliaceum]|uniref:Acyclic sesquiterpene synthase-like isoform X2 n=1 Tax=Panicum miliaceum TaxID=4540 RepID=A0A3L6PZQ0_PANMI|nr:acyclic sesquiterpene synthase-like isoform X2 [Panicum miliaceum]
MARAVKLQAAAGSLPLKACLLGSAGQRLGLLPCGGTATMLTQRSRASRPGVNNGVAQQVRKTLEVEERANSPAENFSRGISTQHNKGTSSDITTREQLQQVDVLQNMGISRHFAGDIKRILERTYSCWLQRDEEIMRDVETCAMAFRILRMNGYDVSADELYHVAEASGFHPSLEGSLNDTRSLLELHKASKVSISEDESILDSIGSWSGCLLKEQLRSGGLQGTPLFREVEHALEFPFYTTLDRLDHRRNIENFDVTGDQMLKASYLSCYTNDNILALGIRDFSTCQVTYQEELRHLDSWVKESRLDQLPFARQKLAYFYLSAAGTIFTPELSDARILWAKNGVLTTVVDDFFDVGGSIEELENLVTLVEMWDEHHKVEFYSEQVEIVFSAIYTSVNELGEKASLLQDRDVTKHLVEIWLDLLRSMMTEVEWRINKYVPTAEEYITNAALTFALGPIVLPALYFVGPKIPESAVKNPEYNELFRLMSTCGRLLNDVQTYEREYSEGKVNSVSLLVLQSGGSMSIAEARREIQKPIDTCRRDLLRLVLRKEAAVPRSCKELFWKMCKVCYFFYSRGDAFSSPEAKAREVNAVLNLPLQLTGSNSASLPVLWEKSNQHA